MSDGRPAPSAARGGSGAPAESSERDAALDPADGFETVAAEEDVVEGELLPVTLSDGAKVCLFNYRGTVGAVDDTCTHAEFSMSEGVLHADGTIECVWHGARFHCMTGAVCRGPAFDPLPTYEVRVVDGTVRVKRRTP